MNSLEQPVGLKVKVTTTLDQSITGHIYACSSSFKIIALKTSNNSGKNHHNSKSSIYKLINTEFIKLIQVLPPNTFNKQKKLFHPYEISIKDIEHMLIRSGEESNPKASIIATKIFSKFLSKFGYVNVSWQSGSDNIILFNEIKSSKPYTLARGNLVKLKSESKNLEIVQNTLKEFWLEIDNEKRGG